MLATEREHGLEALDGANQTAQLLHIATSRSDDLLKGCGQAHRFQLGSRKLQAQFLHHLLLTHGGRGEGLDGGTELGRGDGGGHALCSEGRQRGGHLLEAHAGRGGDGHHVKETGAQFLERRLAQADAGEHDVGHLARLPHFHAVGVDDGRDPINGGLQVGYPADGGLRTRSQEVHHVLAGHAGGDGLIERGHHLIGGDAHLLAEGDDILLEGAERLIRYLRHERADLRHPLLEVHAHLDGGDTEAGDGRAACQRARLQRSAEDVAEALALACYLVELGRRLITGLDEDGDLVRGESQLTQTPFRCGRMTREEG